MADFLTDSDDEKAVEDILSQAMDHSVLEQLAAINCSSFSTIDNLPSHLETRFRKLKSLPTTTSAAAYRFPPAKSKSFRPQSGNDLNADKLNPRFRNSVDFAQFPDLKKSSVKSSPSTDSLEEHLDRNRDEKKGTKSKSNTNSKTRLRSGDDSNSDELNHRFCNSVDFEQISDLNNSSDESRSKSKPKCSSNTNSNSEIRKQSKSKSRSDSWNLSSPESDSGSEPPSPRRSIGCLWCSPKKEKSVSRKQGKENRFLSSFSGNDDDVEFLKTFSIKEGKKLMKKAKEEEEKINREAEKIVKWAKQASSRMMDVSGLDDELSDLDNTK